MIRAVFCHMMGLSGLIRDGVSVVGQHYCLSEYRPHLIW